MGIETLSTRKCQAIMSDNVQLLSSLPWEAFACRWSDMNTHSIFNTRHPRKVSRPNLRMCL